MNRILFCALLYGLIYTAAQKLSDVLQIPNAIGCICIALYLAAVLWFLHTKNRLKKYRICRVKDIRQTVLRTAPLLLLPVCNVFACMAGSGRQEAGVPAAADMILTCLSAFAEELLFRGVLPAEAEERYTLRKTTGAMIISIVFALLHFTGCFFGADLSYSCLQAVFAFGVGFCFAALTEQTGSIIPAVIIHILINLTAAETTGSSAVLPALTQYIPTAASVLSCCYGVRLFRQGRQGGNSNETVH